MADPSFQPVLNQPAGTHIVPNGPYNASFHASVNTNPSSGDKNGGTVVLVAQTTHGVTLDCHSHGAFALDNTSQEVILVDFVTIGTIVFQGKKLRCYNGKHSYPRAVWDADVVARVNSPDGAQLTDSLGDCGHIGCEFFDCADACDISGALRPILDGVWIHDQQPSNGIKWHSDSADMVNGGAVDAIISNFLIGPLGRIEMDVRDTQPNPKGNANLVFRDGWIWNSPGVNWQMLSNGTFTLDVTRERIYSWGAHGVDTDFNGAGGQIPQAGTTVHDIQYHGGITPPTGTTDPRTLWQADNPPGLQGAAGYFPEITDGVGGGGGVVGADWSAGYYLSSNSNALALADASMIGSPTGGDLQFAAVACSNDSAIAATEGGWTDMGEVGSGQHRMHVWRRLYVGAATWNFTSSGGNLAGVLFTVAGQDPSVPFDGTQSTNSSAPAVTTATVTTPALTVDQDLVVAIFCVDNFGSGVSVSTPAGTTARINGLPPAGQSRCSLAVFTHANQAIGTAQTLTATLGSADQYVAMAFLVRGAAPAVSTDIKLTVSAGGQATFGGLSPLSNVAVSVVAGGQATVGGAGAGGVTVPVALTVVAGAQASVDPSAAFTPPGFEADVVLQWSGRTDASLEWDGETDVELEWEGDTDVELLPNR